MKLPTVLALLVTLTACGAHASRAEAPVPAAARSPALFAMQSSFWVNLHHFLYVTARARRGLDRTRAAVTLSLADTTGVGVMPDAMRAGWDRALAYYDRALATRDILFDTALVTVNARLSRVRGDRLDGAGLDSALASALADAAPAYRAVWWPRHDASNQRWIARMDTLLGQRGDSAAAWEARAFGVTWPSQPVATDVVAYANWAGAYTTEDPGHITISSLAPDIQGEAAFETLFHEVLHTMDGRVLSLLRAEADAAGKQLPRDATHAFIFYTAGAVSARLFPGHRPYGEAVGLWSRSPSLGAMHPLLVEHWQPWLDGRGTLAASLRAIVGAL